MKTLSFRALALVVVVLLFSGCITLTDITNGNDQMHLGNYQVGATYRLRQDASLAEFGWRGSLPPFASTPSHALYPLTSHWSPAQGTVAAGTHLRFQKVLYLTYVEDETTFPIAVILDGRYAGMQVGLQDISHRELISSAVAPKNRFLVDPQWLEKDRR